MKRNIQFKEVVVIDGVEYPVGITPVDDDYDPNITNPELVKQVVDFIANSYYLEEYTDHDA